MKARDNHKKDSEAQNKRDKAEALHELQLAMQLQNQEVRKREREIMMQVMMNSMLGVNSAEAEEERLLQRAIEESKNAAPDDPNNPNPDNMTYEQLLALEESNGKVSKGLTKAQINSLPEKMWLNRGDAEEESCSICFDNFERRQKIKKLPMCGHEYHSSCLNKWLNEQKRCPMCNEEVI